jgi:hypothetical protein
VCPYDNDQLSKCIFLFDFLYRFPSQVAYTGYGAPTNVTLSGKDGRFTPDAPIVLKPCLYSDFAVWHMAPRLACGWALLGEMSKWVPISEKRVLAVTNSASGLSVAVAGVPGEVAILTFLNWEKDNALHTVNCTFGGSNSETWVKATATCTASGCTCV